MIELLHYCNNYAVIHSHRFQARHKQNWGRGFILLLPQTAALPESDAGSGVIKNQINCKNKHCQEQNCKKKISFICSKTKFYILTTMSYQRSGEPEAGEGGGKMENLPPCYKIFLKSRDAEADSALSNSQNKTFGSSCLFNCIILTKINSKKACKIII